MRGPGGIVTATSGGLNGGRADQVYALGLLRELGRKERHDQPSGNVVAHEAGATERAGKHEAAPTRKRKASNSGASPPSPHISSKRRGSGSQKVRHNAA